MNHDLGRGIWTRSTKDLRAKSLVRVLAAKELATAGETRVASKLAAVPLEPKQL